MIMKRTTIMLPVDLKARALHLACQKGVSLGEFIRESLSKALTNALLTSPRDPLFADKVIYREESPRDLSENHDDYLYGE